MPRWPGPVGPDRGVDRRQFLRGATTATAGLVLAPSYLLGKVRHVGPKAWYVRGDAPLGGEGTRRSPFSPLDAALAVAAGGDVIRVQNATRPYQWVIDGAAFPGMVTITPDVG